MCAGFVGDPRPEEEPLPRETDGIFEVVLGAFVSSMILLETSFLAGLIVLVGPVEVLGSWRGNCGKGCGLRRTCATI
jgi:hypothetical protein